jgi:trigger factor
MQTTLETLGQLERRLNMAVPAADIEREVGERLKRLARTVRMHGFRPGKVPVRLVTQQYGLQVRSEVIGDAIDKAFNEAVRTGNLRVAGRPRIEPRQDGGAEGQLEFSATFEVYPDVAIGDLAQSEIEKPVLEVTDAEVDKTIEVLRRQRRTFELVERAAERGDQVVIDFTGTRDGAEFPGGSGKDFEVVLGEGRMLGDFEANLIGAAAGESRQFDLTFPEDYGAKDLAGKTVSFAVTVSKVAAPRLPEVDADFARALGVADGDVSQMRAEVRTNVEREVKRRLAEDVKQKAMQALLDQTRLELPRALVDSEIQRLVAGMRDNLQARGLKTDDVPVEPSLFEPQARRRVHLGLAVAELVSSKGLRATSEQVRALVEEHAASYEQPGEVIRWVYSQPERLSEFEAVALEQNVVDWVLREARVTERAVAFDDLMGRSA